MRPRDQRGKSGSTEAGAPGKQAAQGLGQARGAGVEVWLPLASVLFGTGCAYIGYVLFLQTSTLSRSHLATAAALLLVTSVMSWVLSRWWLLREDNSWPNLRRQGLLSLLVPALFLPSLYRAPAFPVSPLLRPWSEIGIVLQSVPMAEAPAPLSKDAVRLTLGAGRAVSRAQLNPNAKWQASPDRSAGAPIGVQEYTWRGEWEGPTSETATLHISPPMVDGQLYVTWDNDTTRVALNMQTGDPIELRKTFRLPWGYDIAFFLSIYIVAAWLLFHLTAGFGRQVAWIPGVLEGRWRPVLIMGAVAAVSVVTAGLQVQHLPDGLQSLTALQLPRHNAVMSGQAPTPWQYRLLSEIVIELIVRLLQLVAVPQAYIPAFLLLRVLQNIAILLLAFALYRILSGSRFWALVGMLVLGASMTRVFYDSDLAFNTYFDVIFYLAAGLLLLSNRFVWVAVLVPFAALNRETSALIPLLMLAAVAVAGKWRGRQLLAVLAAACAFLGVFVGLRLSLPSQPLFVPHGQQLGLPLLVYNLARGITWSGLFATLGFLPLIGLLCLGSWPRLWRAYLVVLCPAWFLANFIGGVAAETRLFLVPEALIFIPGALFCVAAILAADRHPSSSAAMRV